jgi:hypothetical protein
LSTRAESELADDSESGRRSRSYDVATETVKGMSAGGALKGAVSTTCRTPVVPANGPVPALTVSVNVNWV